MMGTRARQASAERKFVVDRTDAPGEKRSTEALRGGRADKPLRNTNQHLAYFGTVSMAAMVGNFNTFKTVAFRQQGDNRIFNEATGRPINTGADIADTFGSIMQNTNEVWLKFALHGKILFVARKNLARRVSWSMLYYAEIAFDYGLAWPQQPRPSNSVGNQWNNQYPNPRYVSGSARQSHFNTSSPQSSNVSLRALEMRNAGAPSQWYFLQSLKQYSPSGNEWVAAVMPERHRISGSQIVVDTNSHWHYRPINPSNPRYDIRLLTGATAPTATTNGQESGLFNFLSGGEWDELLVSVSQHTKWNKRGWASFTNAELGIRTDATNAFRQNGTASWVQESAGRLANYGVFSQWMWRSTTEINYCRILRGFGGRRTGSTGRDDAIVHPDLSTSNIRDYTGPNGPPGSGGGNVNRQFASWRPVLELLNPEDTTHPAGYMKFGWVNNEWGVVFEQVVISGGGRGGGWKGLSRTVPNNVSWTAGV